MADKKIIAVLGATGAQGGGLANAILNDPNSEFSVRAITRNAQSDKAKALASKGADVVEADVNDAESLKKAFQGAYGIYCVTFYWEHMKPEVELAQIRNMVEAAKTVNPKHVIWSTLEDTREWIPLSDERMPTLMDDYKVPHFDVKGMSDQVFKDSGLPVTYLLTSFYWDNFIHFGLGPQKDENGNYALTLPLGNTKLPGIAAEDIGKSAYNVYKAGDTYIGKKIGISGGHLTGKEMADGIGQAIGKDVAYNAVPHDVYRSFGFPGADDMGNMFQFKHDHEEYYTSVRNVEFTRKLNPGLLSFDAWLEKYGKQIPVE